MIFQPPGVLRSVKRSDMRTFAPANLPDRPATSSRTTAMESRMSTLTTRGSICGAEPFAVDPVEEKRCARGQLSSGIAEERCIRVKGGPHQFAFPLPASVQVQLYGFHDSVVLGEVFARVHGATLRL